MKKLLLTIGMTSAFFATAQAGTIDDINMNMLWADNAEFHRINMQQDVQNPDEFAGNVLWADDEEFQRMNVTHTGHNSDYINANMLWADDAEFQAN